MRCISNPTWEAPKAVPVSALQGACWELPGSQGLLLSEEPWEPLFEASHLVGAEGLKENAGISHSQ